MSSIRNLHQSLMAPAGESTFSAELEEVWGAAWGAWDEIGPLERVLVRRPGPELQLIDESCYDEEAGALVDPNGHWYWMGRKAPDLDLVAAQHDGLVATLRAQGIEVVVAPPMGAGFVKSVYVRDPLVTVPGGAIVGRMGVRMRRGEEPDISAVVAAAGLPILGTIVGKGTLEGGSFVKLVPGLAALGVSIRCNREGASQLRAILRRIGWELLIVPISGYSIHLDLHLAMVDRRTALVDAEHLPYSFLQRLQELGVELLHPAGGEAWALNCLTLRPGCVLMAEGSPRTQEMLRSRGIEVLTVPYDELHKNGGGVHCSTMELVRRPAEA